MAVRTRKYTDFDWKKRIKEFRSFVRKQGHNDVESEWKNNPELAGFAKYVRQNLAKFDDKKREDLIKAKFFDEWEISWLDMYHSLVIFKETIGHPHVPARWKRNPALAKWVDIQREYHKRGELYTYQIELLEKIQFRWRQRSIKREPWDVRYEQLMEYKDEFGDCQVPAKYTPNPPLGTWVSSIRLGIYSCSQQQEEKLDLIGFCWDPIGEFWEDKFKQLKDYKKQYGSCIVSPSIHKELSIWVANTRRRKHRLSDSQIRRLNRLGFDWNPYQTSWQNQYEALLKYKQKKGHCCVGRTDPASYEELRQWVGQQRRDYKEGKISQQKLEKLEAIDFVWDMNQARWEIRFAELIAFKKEHGHCRVPTKSKQNPALGNGCGTIRNQWKLLPIRRKQRLKEIGFEQTFNSPPKK